MLDGFEHAGEWQDEAQEPRVPLLDRRVQPPGLVRGILPQEEARQARHRLAAGTADSEQQRVACFLLRKVAQHAGDAGDVLDASRRLDLAVR